MSKALRNKLAGVLSVAMLAGSITTPILANDYQNHWANEAITKWQEKGILKGYEDGSFKPKQAVTRAELAAMLVRVFGLTQTTNQKCEDVAQDAWYAGDIAKIIAADIMNYEANTFRPEEPATREEAAYAIAKAYHITGETKTNFTDNAKIADWAEDEIASLVAGGYLSGRPDGTFAPADTLTRADAVTMLDKITAQIFNEKGTYSENIEGNVIINAKDVILKDMTINGNLYIAEGVGNGDVTLENVKVTGKVFVEGGGMDTVELKGTTAIEALIIDKAKDAVRILTTGEASVKEVEIKSESKLQGNFGFVQITSKVPVTLGEGTKVATLLVAPEAKDTTLTLEKDASIIKATLEAPLTLTGKGKIEILEVADDVKVEDIQSDITIDKAPEGMPGTGTTPGGGGSTGGDTSEPTKTYSITGKVYLGEEVTTSAAIKATPYYKDSEGKISFDHTNEVIIKTDAEGNYSLGRIKKGRNYKLSASDNTRPEALYLQDIYLESITANQEVDIHLTQKTSLDFKVTADGKPVTKPVEVKLRWINPDGTYGRFSDGWIFDGEAAWRGWQIGDQVEVDVIDPRYEPTKVRTTITEQTRNWVEVELVEKQIATLTGKITLPNGTPAKGTEVALYRMEGEYNSKRIAETTTDANGNYTFKNVAVDDYRLEVTHITEQQDYYVSASKFKVEPGTVTKNLKLAPVKSIILNIKDEAGNPIPNVEYELESRVEGDGWGRGSRSDEDGQIYVIAGDWAADREVTYTLKKSGYKPLTGTFKIGEAAKYRDEITMESVPSQERSTLTGKLTLDSTGAVAAGAQVRLYRYMDNGHYSRSYYITDVTTDEQGNYEIDDLLPGEYGVRVTYKDADHEYAPKYQEHINVYVDTTQNYSLIPATRLTVDVKDAANLPAKILEIEWQLYNANGEEINRNYGRTYEENQASILFESTYEAGMYVKYTARYKEKLICEGTIDLTGESTKAAIQLPDQTATEKATLTYTATARQDGKEVTLPGAKVTLSTINAENMWVEIDTHITDANGVCTFEDLDTTLVYNIEATYSEPKVDYDAYEGDIKLFEDTQIQGKLYQREGIKWIMKETNGQPLQGRARGKVSYSYIATQREKSQNIYPGEEASWTHTDDIYTEAPIRLTIEQRNYDPYLPLEKEFFIKGEGRQELEVMLERYITADQEALTSKENETHKVIVTLSDKTDYTFDKDNLPGVYRRQDNVSAQIKNTTYLNDKQIEVEMDIRNVQEDACITLGTHIDGQQMETLKIPVTAYEIPEEAKQIHGKITYPSGEAVPYARVAITTWDQSGQSSVYEITANKQGEYAFTDLPNMTNFRLYSTYTTADEIYYQAGIDLPSYTVGEKLEQNFTLQQEDNLLFYLRDEEGEPLYDERLQCIISKEGEVVHTSTLVYDKERIFTLGELHQPEEGAWYDIAITDKNGVYKPINTGFTYEKGTIILYILLEKETTTDLTDISLDLGQVEVDYGTTTSSALQVLPQTAQLDLDDETTKDITLTWECPDYDPTQAGTYTFKSTVVLPENITNKQNKNLYFEIQVIVKEQY